MNAGNRNDRDTERRRYNQRAQDLLTEQSKAKAHLEALECDHERPPYDAFREALDRLVTPTSKVLEIGGGTGRYTLYAAKKSAMVIPVDISEESLRVARASIRPTPLAVAADIAELPIASASIDLVIGAGSMSYAAADQLDAEMCRVLKPGGSLLIVDSLNDSPIYRFNRWLKYRRGERTAITLQNMPTVARMEALAARFERSSLTCYGTFVFLYPIARRVWGPSRAASLLNRLDDRFGGGRNAFKVVLVAEGLRSQ